MDKKKKFTVDLDFLTHIYNCGYHAGHSDTVEGYFVDVGNNEMTEYHSEDVEILHDELKEFSKGE